MFPFLGWSLGVFPPCLQYSLWFFSVVFPQLTWYKSSKCAAINLFFSQCCHFHGSRLLITVTAKINVAIVFLRSQFFFDFINTFWCRFFLLKINQICYPNLTSISGHTKRRDIRRSSETIGRTLEGGTAINYNKNKKCIKVV